MYGVIKNTVD